MNNMFPAYCSKHNSVQTEDLTQPPFSKTVPETPARADRKPVFFTEPESPRDNRPPSDEHALDIDILIHKLQLHQLEVEQAILRYRQRKATRQGTFAIAITSSSTNITTLPKCTCDFSRSTRAGMTEQDLESKPLPPIAVEISEDHFTSQENIFGSLQQRSAGRALRTRRPAPLDLLGVQDVKPQEVQSARLPQARSKASPRDGPDKQLWRRMTVSAGKHSSSTIVMMSAPGELREFEFTLPPVPVLTSSTSTTPITPNPIAITPSLESDQSHRGEEVILPEASSDVVPDYHEVDGFKKAMHEAHMPAVSSRSLPKILEQKDNPDRSLNRQANKPEPPSPKNDTLRRKKSFFDRFERRTRVDDVLDMYMTQEQLDHEKDAKQKASKPKRQAMFRMWPTNDRQGVRQDIPD